MSVRNGFWSCMCREETPMGCGSAQNNDWKLVFAKLEYVWGCFMSYLEHVWKYGIYIKEEQCTRGVCPVCLVLRHLGRTGSWKTDTCWFLQVSKMKRDSGLERYLFISKMGTTVGFAGIEEFIFVQYMESAGLLENVYIIRQFRTYILGHALFAES